MSIPNSTISVCSGVRLSNRYEHTYYWESRDAQSNYFSTKTVKKYSEYSFIRKSKSIKIQASYDFARTWDYLYFTNYRTTDGAPGKTYYCFITSVEYVSDSTVEVFYEVDVMQTYALDYELLRCFVEREHTATDEIGEHTVEENLDLGELTTIMSQDVSMGELCILILTTIDIGASIGSDDDPVPYKGTFIDGVFNGCGIVAVPKSEWESLAIVLSELDSKGFSDGILAMWMYPKKLVNLKTDYNWDVVVNEVSSIQPFFQEVDRPTVLDNGYTPRNNKLFTYPFSQLYITNNTGGSASFRWERFGNRDKPNFKITGAISPQAHVRLYPMNYNGEQHAYEHGLSMEGYPTCAWNQDVYKLWLAQNQNQHTLGMVGAGAGIIAGVATAFVNPLAGVGMIAGSAGSIANAVAQKRDMAVQPPQAKGSYSTSVNTAAGFQTFTFKGKCVSEENARILDSYFDLYGYRVNEVKVPSRHNRKYWTYVKTIGCHIQAEFPAEDASKIESIFDAGITFWAQPAHMGYYNSENTPL